MRVKKWGISLFAESTCGRKRFLLLFPLSRAPRRASPPPPNPPPSSTPPQVPRECRRATPSRAAFVVSLSARRSLPALWAKPDFVIRPPLSTDSTPDRLDRDGLPSASRPSGDRSATRSIRSIRSCRRPPAPGKAALVAAARAGFSHLTRLSPLGYSSPLSRRDGANIPFRGTAETRGEQPKENAAGIKRFAPASHRSQEIWSISRRTLVARSRASAPLCWLSATARPEPPVRVRRGVFLSPRNPPAATGAASDHETPLLPASPR